MMMMMKHIFRLFLNWKPLTGIPIKWFTELKADKCLLSQFFILKGNFFNIDGIGENNYLLQGSISFSVDITN